MISKPIIFIIKTTACYNGGGKVKKFDSWTKKVNIYISLKEILFYCVGGSNYYLL